MLSSVTRAYRAPNHAHDYVKSLSPSIDLFNGQDLYSYVLCEGMIIRLKDSLLIAGNDFVSKSAKLNSDATL